MQKIRWRNFKIGAKYGFALFITIILFIVASGFVTTSLFEIRDAVDAIENTADRAITLTQMGSLFRGKQLIISDYTNLARGSLVDEYKKIKNGYEDLQTQIEPQMDTEEFSFLFELIKRNNKQLDETFENVIIPSMKEGKTDEAIAGVIKISGFSTQTVLTIEKLKVSADEERHKAMTNAHEYMEKSIKVLMISIISAVILGSFIVFLISRSISRNLKQVVNITGRISKGELAVEEIKYQGNDEIGQLSLSMNNMLHNLQNIIREISESAFKVDDESNALRKIADDVQESSEQIAATMQEMAAGAEEQASSASEIANSIFNLTELIKKANVNKGALEASSKDILDVVQDGNIQMETSIGTMNHINDILKDSVVKVKQLDENSQKVSILVQIINSIAEQTNLLALNAAIEAARAGDAGRGFAVVADEIRKLAEQVGKSVKEITDIVIGIQDESRAMTDSLEKGYHKVEEGTHKIKVTGEIFERINNEINTMVERINNVSQNLNEISENSGTISSASEQIAAISEENSAGIEQTVASVQQQNSSMEIITQNAHSLSSSADMLKKLVNQFKL